MRNIALVLLLTLAASTAYAVIETYEFSSPALEARYKVLSQELRCPKCLNTNLAGSDAPIAQDLRKTVYRLVAVEGMSDQEVRDYLQARYGDFVLYNPPFNARTWYIWLVPIGLGLLALFVLYRLQLSARAQHTGLDDEQQKRLQNIVASKTDT